MVYDSFVAAFNLLFLYLVYKTFAFLFGWFIDTFLVRIEFSPFFHQQKWLYDRVNKSYEYCGSRSVAETRWSFYFPRYLPACDEIAARRTKLPGVVRFFFFNKTPLIQSNRLAALYNKDITLLNESIFSIPPIPANSPSTKRRRDRTESINCAPLETIREQDTDVNQASTEPNVKPETQKIYNMIFPEDVVQHTTKPLFFVHQKYTDGLAQLVKSVHTEHEKAKIEILKEIMMNLHDRICDHFNALKSEIDNKNYDPVKPTDKISVPVLTPECKYTDFIMQTAECDTGNAASLYKRLVSAVKDYTESLVRTSEYVFEFDPSTLAITFN